MGDTVITFDMVESGGSITACKMLGSVPESHEAEDFNLYVRTVGSTVRVDRSDTDETIVKGASFIKAMTALADHYGLPVVIQADCNVKVTKKAAELIGRYEPSTVRTEVRIFEFDGEDTTLVVGDLITAKDMVDAPTFEITAIGGRMGVVVRDVATNLRHVPRDIRYVVPGYLTVKAAPVAEAVPTVPVMIDDLIADKVDGFTYVVTRADEFWIGLRQVGSWREGRNIRTADFVKHLADGALVNVSEGARVVEVVARLNYFGRTLVNGADVMMEVKPEHVRAALNADMITVDGEWMSVTPAGMDLLGEGDRARAWDHFNPGVLGVAVPTERVAFTPTEEEIIWARTYTMIKPTIRTKLAKRSRKSARRARRGLKGGM